MTTAAIQSDRVNRRHQNRFQTAIHGLLALPVIAAPLAFHSHLIDFSNRPKKRLLRLVIGLLLLLCLLQWRSTGRVFFVQHPVLLPFAGRLLWAAVTLVWAVDPMRAFSCGSTGVGFHHPEFHRSPAD